MNKSITFLFIAFISLLWSCGNGDREEHDHSGQVLHLNLSVEPPTLDPRKASDTSSGIVLKMLFEGLTRIQPDGKYAFAIAESVDISEDQKTYRFTLRDSKWSNGDPITAYDFEYAWKTTLAPSFDSHQANQLFIIKNAMQAKTGKVPLDVVGIHVIDDKTLVVSLEYPSPYFLDLTADPTYYPVNRNIVERDKKWADEASEAYTSNGPFKLVDWKHDNELVLEKNPYYWDAPTVKLNKIIIWMISQGITELHLFENHELDWAGSPMSHLSVDAIPQLKERGDVKSKPIAGIQWYYFNTERAPFDNVKMRKAFGYAINRQEIIDNLLPDSHEVATGLLPPTIVFQKESFFKDGDVEMARKLFYEALREMKINKSELPSITLTYNTNEIHHRLAQAIQQQWKQAFGIQVNLEALEWQVHMDKLHHHDYQIGRMGWVAFGSRDPLNFLRVFKYKDHASEGGSNDTQWENPQFISIIDQATIETDVEKRKDLLYQAEKIILNEMPVIPIYFMTYSYMKSPNLHDVYFSDLGDIDFKWAYFAK